MERWCRTHVKRDCTQVFVSRIRSKNERPDFFTNIGMTGITDYADDFNLQLNAVACAKSHSRTDGAAIREKPFGSGFIKHCDLMRSGQLVVLKLLKIRLPIICVHSCHPREKIFLSFTALPVTMNPVKFAAAFLRTTINRQNFKEMRQ